MYQAERKAVNRKLEYRNDSRTIEEDPDAVAIVSAEFAAERPQAANETGRRPKDFAQELPVLRPGSCNQHENHYWLKADTDGRRMATCKGLVPVSSSGTVASKTVN